MQSWMPTIFIISYAIIVISIAYLPKVRTTLNTEDYFLGGRTFSFLVLYMTVAATAYSGFALMGTPGLWYSKGVGAFFVFTYIAFGYAILYMVGPRIWEVGKENGYVTQADLLGDRFDSDLVRGISSITGFVMTFPYIAVGFIACSYVITILTYGVVPHWASGLIVLAITIVYIWVGGIRAISWTDVVQGFIMLIALIGCGFFVLYHYYPGLSELFEALAQKEPEKLSFSSGYSWPMYTSLIIMAVWGFISWPHIFIRIYAAKSPKVIKFTSAIGPIGAFIAYVPMMIAAFAILTASTTNFAAPDKALLTDLGQIAPVWFFALVGLGALASAMSTVDSQAHVTGVIIARDFFQKILKREMTEKQVVTICRVVIVIGLIGSYLIALNPPELMWNILISAYAGVSQLVPLIIAALYWKRATKTGAAAGLIVGLITAILFSYVWEHPLGIHAGVWGMVFNTIVLVVLSYMTMPPSPEKIARFYK